MPLPTIDDTWGVPQGDGAILGSGHKKWVNLGSTGANSCIIIAARVPKLKKMALAHFDVFNNTLNSVAQKIESIRFGSTVELYLVSNYFNMQQVPPQHQGMIQWAKTRPWASSVTIQPALRVAISVDSGEYTTHFDSKQMFMDSDSNSWMSGGNRPIKWKDIGPKLLF